MGGGEEELKGEGAEETKQNPTSTRQRERGMWVGTGSVGERPGTPRAPGSSPTPSQVRPPNFPEDTTPSWAGRRPTAPEPPNQRHSQSDGGGAG